jgi:glutathione-regulated potassium-efflux system ancillary protein KefG
MNRILILFAHPAFERSRVQRSLIEAISQLDGITIHDLYEDYPEFDIDIEKEKQLLLQHPVIVWQHPLFWYSGPALLKQWQDLVLEHGWAYGTQGHALDGKKIFNAITSGGEMEAYRPEGLQRSTIKDFLLPFERTAQLCRMIYLPPFWVPGTHKLNPEQIRKYSDQYRKLLILIRDSVPDDRKIPAVSFLNELVTTE